MATVFSSFFKKLSGKIDNLILYESRGQTRLRSKGIKKYIPNASAQQLQQNRLRAAVAFYRANDHPRLPHIWRTAARKLVMSGYNLFLHSNMAVFDQQHRISDYSMLHISQGTLEFPQSMKITAYGKGQIRLEWQNVLPETSSHMSDRLHLYWLNDQGIFSLQTPPMPCVLRKDGYALLSIPEAGRENMHLYFYFSNTEENNYSADKYFYLQALE